MNNISLENLREFVYQWNNKYPFDRWWREKHNAGFLSAQHREMNLIDMRLEYEEDRIFEELKEKKKYQPGKGDWLLKDEDRKLTPEEVDVAFDKLDINSLNKNARR